MRLIASLALIPLTACTLATSNATGAPIHSPGYPPVCSNDELAQFAGQPASQELGARMLQASGAKTIRWVPKGSMITMEYNAERVTVHLDGSNRVERASCG